jgi:hypothetical protein
MSAGGVAIGNGTDESMDEGMLDMSSNGAGGICIGGGIDWGGEPIRRGEGCTGDDANHERLATVGFCAAIGWAPASNNGSCRSGVAGVDDVTGSDAEGAESGAGIGMLEAGARRLGADAVAAAWTSASFSLPLAREMDPNQDEERFVGGEADTGNATRLVSGLSVMSSLSRGGTSGTSGITSISWGRSLVREAAGLEGPATGPRLKASILSRALPCVPESSAPTTTQEILASGAELKVLSFLTLRELGGRQTVGRGDLVDAVLRMDAVEGCRERRGGLLGLESVVSRALMRRVPQLVQSGCSAQLRSYIMAYSHNKSE